MLRPLSASFRKTFPQRLALWLAEMFDNIIDHAEEAASKSCYAEKLRSRHRACDR